MPFLAQCVNWIMKVTNDEDRDELKMYLRTKQTQILKEKINVYMGKFDDTNRTKVYINF